MNLIVVILLSFTFSIYFLICVTGFERYLFQKNRGILSYLITFVYLTVVPVTHSVFSVGAATIIILAFHEFGPISWVVPVFSYIGAMLLGTVPAGLPNQSKGLKMWLYICPICLAAAGYFIMFKDPWWNHQFAITIHPLFPSIGVLMLVSNSGAVVTNFIVPLIKRKKSSLGGV